MCVHVKCVRARVCVGACANVRAHVCMRLCTFVYAHALGVGVLVGSMEPGDYTCQHVCGGLLAGMCVVCVHVLLCQHVCGGQYSSTHPFTG